MNNGIQLNEEPKDVYFDECRLCAAACGVVVEQGYSHIVSINVVSWFEKLHRIVLSLNSD